MLQGLSLVRRGRFSVLRGFLLWVMIAGLSGCGTLLVPDPNVIIPCAPTPDTQNLYRAASRSWADLVVGYAFSPAFPISASPPGNAPPPIQLNEQQLPAARYAALQYLIAETKHWSDVEIIKLDGANETQIIVTFISPEILQSVFLSELLKDRLVASDFKTKNQDMLNAIAERNELLFLVTVTTTNTNLTSHIIKIPLHDMIQTTAGDIKISPAHDDHNLEQPINTAAGPVYGYLAYPLAKITDGQCKLILDPKYNTNIVISVNSIVVDITGSGPYSWVFPYKSLINPMTLPDPPDFNMPLGYDQNLMTPLSAPPAGINQTDNWRDFARFVWYQVVKGDY